MQHMLEGARYFLSTLFSTAVMHSIQAVRAVRSCSTHMCLPCSTTSCGYCEISSRGGFFLHNGGLLLHNGGFFLHNGGFTCAILTPTTHPPLPLPHLACPLHTLLPHQHHIPSHPPIVCRPHQGGPWYLQWRAPLVGVGVLVKQCKIIPQHRHVLLPDGGCEDNGVGVPRPALLLCVV